MIWPDLVHIWQNTRLLVYTPWPQPRPLLWVGSGPLLFDCQPQTSWSYPGSRTKTLLSDFIFALLQVMTDVRACVIEAAQSPNVEKCMTQQ